MTQEWRERNATLLQLVQETIDHPAHYGGANNVRRTSRAIAESSGNPMKTTFEDFEKTALYGHLVETYERDPHNREKFLVSLKTAFLVGHQLGGEEATAALFHVRGRS